VLTTLSPMPRSERQARPKQQAQEAADRGLQVILVEPVIRPHQSDLNRRPVWLGGAWLPDPGSRPCLAASSRWPVNGDRCHAWFDGSSKKGVVDRARSIVFSPTIYLGQGA